MDINEAVTGMLDARAQLRTRKGINDPFFISEQMQRLAQYTGAVEEHLAEVEEQQEIEEEQAFRKYSAEGKSVNAAQDAAKYDTAKLKGEIKKLKRYVGSSWSIVGVAQSRFNHLQKDTVGQV